MTPDFTVSHKKGRAQTAQGNAASQATSQATSSSSATSSTPMKMVTCWNKFKEFQQEVIPIIENIIRDEAVSNHPFTQRWASAKITANSTFRTVASNLALKDIQEYRQFLMTAPKLTDTSSLVARTRVALGFSIISNLWHMLKSRKLS
jgi:hypothetical protein